MMLGLTLAQFTLLHVAISLVAILAGVAFFFAVLRGGWPGAVNATFLLFTILTSVTGFLFPPKPIGPPFLFGVVSLVLLAVALYALYGRGLAGRWRGAYLLAALIAQWLNMVVLVVQGFQKIPALNAFAPTGNEPPLLGAQAVLLLAVAYTGWASVAKGRAVAAAH
jgi:hypothetical protein